MSLLGMAILAALAAASSLGASWALQHQAARRVRRPGAVRARLLLDLARKPTWSASLACTLVGVGLQCLALVTGPLVLVQSILVTALVVAVVFSHLLRRQRPDRIVLLGAGLCVAGLVGFLVIAQPAAGGTRATPAAALGLAAGVIVLLVACLGIASRTRGRPRTLGLASAAGILYGVTAGLAKVAAGAAEHGILAVLGHWPVYLVVVCGPMGFLLTQNAFNAGVALSPALAVITVGEPLTALAMGVLWLGETVRGGPLPVIGETTALLVLCAGVVVLSRRAPQVTQPRSREQPAAPEPKPA
jgi:drug/metabolite transporter (DMT)-like permease